MEKYIELTKEELIHLNGGMSVFEKIGYAIGAVAANTVDWIYGAAEGIIKAMEEETE
ncbi:hypothetical protein [uncultured Draconibacterium sp.]|uniref:hypothetical protein n=1 Tax=uncultured Draconibacterium sp. TaxID=1573823 RepID=UPI0029C8AD03|nr:hypothetical protein [uncultured Draconibacterium sp.]